MKKEELRFEGLTTEEMINTNGGGVSEGTGKFLRWLGKVFASHNDPDNKEAWYMTHKM